MKKMKYSFLLSLFVSVTVYAQKVDVLLIGVSHNYSNYPAQDFSGIYKKIKQFKPTAFFGEFLSKQDEQNLMDYWCKDDNLKRLQTLRNNRNIKPEQLPKTIDSLKKLIRLRPHDYHLKTDLAHAYYLDQDVPKAHYQYWQVYNRLQNNPDAVLEKYVQNLLSPATDKQGRSMTRLHTSEYAFIAFPMMQELNIAELIPMDCQDYDLNWSASALAFYNQFQPYLKDSNAAYAQDLQAMLDKRNKGFEKNAGMEKSSNHLTEWFNTDEAAAIFASGDFYFPELYELAGFPKEAMLSQLHWWLMRNKVMCENVVSRAQALKQQKVVVIVGANHRKFMQDILAQMPGVTVKNINELN